jgi:hypothetical protein
MSFNNCNRIIKGNIKLLDKVYLLILLFVIEICIKGLSLLFAGKLVYSKVYI